MIKTVHQAAQLITTTIALDHLKLEVNFHNLCVDIIPMEICVLCIDIRRSVRSGQPCALKGNATCFNQIFAKEFSPAFISITRFAKLMGSE